jgi:hypothetical protein
VAGALSISRIRQVGKKIKNKEKSINKSPVPDPFACRLKDFFFLGILQFWTLLLPS